jgi:hypothetical protein
MPADSSSHPPDHSLPAQCSGQLDAAGAKASGTGTTGPAPLGAAALAGSPWWRGRLFPAGAWGTGIDSGTRVVSDAPCTKDSIT